MDVDPERTTNQDIILVGMMDVPVEKDSKRPVVLNNQVFQRDLLLLVTMRPVDVVPTPSTFYRPMVPQGKEWRAKTTPQAEAVKPVD
jgi:hypothetical protein